MHLECSNSPLPDLEESDIDSYNDSVPDPGFESGRDDIYKDFWSNHPSCQLDFDPEQSTIIDPVSPPMKPPDVTIAQEEASDSQILGCSVDSKSLTLQNKYYCSIGECQVLPGVCCALHLEQILVVKVQIIGNTLLDGIN